jgi:hypothetical protein
LARSPRPLRLSRIRPCKRRNSFGEAGTTAGTIPPGEDRAGTGAATPGGGGSAGAAPPVGTAGVTRASSTGIMASIIARCIAPDAIARSIVPAISGRSIAPGTTGQAMAAADTVAADIAAAAGGIEFDGAHAFGAEPYRSFWQGRGRAYRPPIFLPAFRSQEAQLRKIGLRPSLRSPATICARTPRRRPEAGSATELRAPIR